MADYRFHLLATMPGHGILTIDDKPFAARFLTPAEAKAKQAARMASSK